MLRALQADAQRQDCAWLASLPPLPGTNGAAITALLQAFVRQQCASMPCMARPCMCLASKLLEQKGSLRACAEAIQSGELMLLSSCSLLMLAGRLAAGHPAVKLKALFSFSTSHDAHKCMSAVLTSRSSFLAAHNCSPSRQL